MSTPRRPLGTGPQLASTTPAAAAGTRRLPADVDGPVVLLDDDQEHEQPARRRLGTGPTPQQITAAS